MAYFKPEKFKEVIYFSGATGSGNLSGSDSSNAKAIADNTNVWPIPAGCLIEKCYVIIDTELTGTTDMDFGDDDDPNGYIDGSVSLSALTPGVYGWNAKVAGAYLRVETAGGTDAADIDVVPNAKYYSAAGKEIKLDATGTNTAGAFRLVIEGTMI